MVLDRRGLRLLLTPLPGEAFLRRDRGEALYVTNAPRFGWNDPGDSFAMEIRSGLAYLTPLPFLMERADADPDELAQTLTQFRGSCEETLPLFIQGIKLLEAPNNDMLILCDRNLRRHAALALRGSVNGQGLYYCALVLSITRMCF